MDINETADKIYQRWRLSARPIITCKAELGALLGITIGLGALFNEERGAEIYWLNTFNRALGGTPSTFILQGRFDEVLAIVNQERNL